MPETRRPRRNRSVLVSGAGIAGPAIAYWLHRHGFDVTVVEKAGAVRGGGYPIDIRGTALEVVRRMNILPQLQKAHVNTHCITFVDTDGSTIATLSAESVAIGADGDLEVQRGDLTETIYDAVRESVTFMFNDSIATLDDRTDGIEVTFRSGARHTFDVVIGADGIHSHTRRLIFGPEEPFHHYLGACFAGFTLPNHLGLSHEGMLWNTPSQRAALYAAGSGGQVFGLLSFRRPDLPLPSRAAPTWMGRPLLTRSVAKSLRKSCGAKRISANSGCVGIRALAALRTIWRTPLVDRARGVPLCTRWKR